MFWALKPSLPPPMCQVQRSPFLLHEGRWLITAHRPSVLVCGGQEKKTGLCGRHQSGVPAPRSACRALQMHRLKLEPSAHGSRGQSCAIHAPLGAPRELSLVERLVLDSEAAEEFTPETKSKEEACSLTQSAPSQQFSCVVPFSR